MMDENFKTVLLYLANGNEDHNYNETSGFPMVHLREESDSGDDFQMSLMKEDSVEDDNTSENTEDPPNGRASTWASSKSVNIIYPCYLCNFETCRSTSLVAHLRQHRQSGLILETERFQIGKFVCQICNFKTRWLSSLKEHEESVHFSNNDSINSALNNDDDDNDINLNINSSNSSNADHDDYLSNDVPYNCRLCGFSAEKLDNLTAHMKRHFNFINVFGNLVRNYPCCLCEYTTRQFDELQAHVNFMHSSSAFNSSVLVQPRTKCARFEQLFDNSNDAVPYLPKNEEILSPEYPCDYCSHRAASIYLWRDHMESHGGVLEISVSSAH